MHRVVLGNKVYRLAQDPAPTDQAPDQTVQEKAPDKTVGPDVEAIKAKMDGLRVKMTEQMDKYGVKGEAPRYIATKEGFRLASQLTPSGAITDDGGILTFDFSVEWVYDISNENKLANKLGIDEYWQKMFSLKGWNDTPISLVEWYWCNQHYVATESQKFLAGLLESISLLQQVDARTEMQNMEPAEGADAETLKDWVVGQALNMIKTGVGAEHRSEVDEVKKTISQLTQGGQLDVFENNLILTILNAFAKGNDKKLIEVKALEKQMKANKQLKPATIQKVVDAVLKVQQEPADYLERNRFIKLVEKTTQDQTLVEKATKALKEFKSDEEWAAALKEGTQKPGGPHTPAPAQAQLTNAVKQLSKGKYTGAVQAFMAEDGKLVARLKAPYPFFYVFSHEAGKLVPVEAAMQICNRVVFVSQAAGNFNLHEKLLKADFYLAQAFKNAAGQAPQERSRPKTVDDMANALAKLLEKRQEETTAAK